MKRLIAGAMMASSLLFGVNGSAAAESAVRAPHWITTEDNQNQHGSMLCFTRDIDIDAVPESVPVRISADSKYWMWINGEEVVIEGGVKRGPNPHDIYFDSIDLAKWLKPGKNRVAVQLWYFGKPSFSHNSTGKASLFIDSPNLPELNTTKKWVGRRHPAFFVPMGAVPNYRLPESNIGFDARYDIEGWQQIGWDPTKSERDDLKNRHGGKWFNAIELGVEGDKPWGKLSPRLIPMWRDNGQKPYVWIERRKGTRDTIVAKLPYNCHAMPYIKMSSPAGEMVEIVTDNYRGGSENNVRAMYITKDGRQEYENMGWMNGEYVYYIIPTNATVEKLAFRETGYDTDFAGTFACSDDLLNRYRKKAERTLYVTMRDTYMDCPDRERAQWWGDVVNESGEAFYALSRSADNLMKKGMYELIGWQRPDGSICSPTPADNWDKELPGQMLASVGHYGFYNYYLNTGDIEPVRDLYEGVKRYISLWKNAPDGTVADRDGGWHWGDWGDNIDKIGMYNCLHQIALRGLKEMAEALGKTEEADSIAKVMAANKEAFNRIYWTGTAYRHPEYKECTDDRVQALAVVAGLADPDKYDAILKVLENCRHASPYTEKYVTEAYFIMGKGKQGLDRMKERYAKMVNHPDYSTLFEGWGIGAEGFGGGTTNHAWSGGGLTILSQYVCGIAPTKPGYEEFRVAPRLSGLEWVETVVPSVKGNIDFKAKENASGLEFSFTVPKGSSAIVDVPAGYSNIKCNGKAKSNGFSISKPGKYTVKARK